MRCFYLEVCSTVPALHDDGFVVSFHVTCCLYLLWSCGLLCGLQLAASRTLSATTLRFSLFMRRLRGKSWSAVNLISALCMFQNLSPATCHLAFPDFNSSSLPSFQHALSGPGVFLLLQAPPGSTTLLRLGFFCVCSLICMYTLFPSLCASAVLPRGSSYLLLFFPRSAVEGSAGMGGRQGFYDITMGALIVSFYLFLLFSSSHLPSDEWL